MTSKLGQTPSQTVGPYFAYGLTGDQYGFQMKGISGSAMAPADIAGERIRIEGVVRDGHGEPIPDALIEVWQADAQGRYAHPADPRGSNAAFKGFGRMGTGTDPQRRFVFDTIKPGRVDGRQAPHINVIVTMRGLLNHLFTRIYFSDEAAANAADPVLQSVPTERRPTLIAERRDTQTGPVYRFDIHMQGPNETVFFDA
jgi:protocatechuate 3,4-dioxygenase alpha subunit